MLSGIVASEMLEESIVVGIVFPGVVNTGGAEATPYDGRRLNSVLSALASKSNCRSSDTCETPVCAEPV